MRTWKQKFEDLAASMRMPVDVLPFSNGEFVPPAPTREQKLIMALQEEKGEQVRRRLGMSRRDFVRSSAAFGVGFWAIGQVRPGRFGTYSTRSQREGNPWPASGDACELEYPEAQLNNMPGEFIFDVQSHHVDPAGTWRWSNPGFHAVFAALWSQSGPLGGYPGISDDGEISGWGEGGELDPIENLSRFHYIKELFLDSATNMTVLSAVPSAPDLQNPLRISEAAETVGTVRSLAGTDRTVLHAFVMPNRGSIGTGQTVFGAEPAFMQEEFEFMEETASRWTDRLRGWKVYTPWGDVPNSSGWFLDDPIGDAFAQRVRELGDRYGTPKVIACHKGFSLPTFDGRAASARDIGPAAKRNQDITYIVYHSGYDSETQRAYPGDENVNSADRGVDTFVKSLRENQWDASQFVEPGLEHGNVPNVFAEIGSVVSGALSDPDELTHLLGKLITHVGPQRVAWGTDCLWGGSPQGVITGLRAAEFTEEGKALYNLPYGLDGDRFDPRRDTMDPSHYVDHPNIEDWPKDFQSHPERSIRNGIFGRNAAVPYRVDPDEARGFIQCDDVQKIRDAYLVNETTPAPDGIEVVQGRTNVTIGARTPQQLWREKQREPWGP